MKIERISPLLWKAFAERSNYVRSCGRRLLLAAIRWSLPRAPRANEWSLDASGYPNARSLLDVKRCQVVCCRFPPGNGVREDARQAVVLPPCGARLPYARRTTMSDSVDEQRSSSPPSLVDDGRTFSLDTSAPKSPPGGERDACDSPNTSVSTAAAEFIVEVLTLVVAITTVLLTELAYFVGVLRRPRKSLRDRVVLLTGAGHGIGRLLAVRLAQQGARCVLVDINKAANEDTAAELRGLGFCHVHAFHCDVANESEVKRLKETISEEVGVVDVVINNAAVVNCDSILLLSSERVRKTFEVNVLAHIWMIREFLPDMLRQQRGHIVAMGSIAGVIGASYLTDYCASKSAVRGLMLSLEEELHALGFHRGIQLTTVHPVAVNTGMFKSPYSRFPLLTPILEADAVADGVLEAILTDRFEAVLPWRVGAAQRLVSLLPDAAVQKLQRFVSYGVGPHRHTQKGKVAAD